MKNFPGLVVGALGLAFLLAGGCAFAKEAAMKDIDKIPASCQTSPYGPGDWFRKTEFQNRTRRYIVHVPAGYNRARRYPLVFMFHGGGGTAMGTRGFPGWDQLADREGFLVVYPDGTGFLPRKLHTFNAGSCCGYAMKKKVDDVGFTSAMIDEMERTFCVDPARVYATGFSNGAMMSYRLGCELSNRIAAIGPVSGTLGIDSCHPSRPVSLMHIHGTADPYEPYVGGKGEKSFPGLRHKTTFRSVADTIAIWTRLIGASKMPTAHARRGDATMEEFAGGRDGSEVVLWTIRGGGHTWPGAKSMPGGWWLGKANQDVSATQLLWDFFKKHPMKR